MQASDLRPANWESWSERKTEMNATKDSITTSVESCALGDWIDNLGELAVRYAWADNPECSWKEICNA